MEVPALPQTPGMTLALFLRLCAPPFPSAQWREQPGPASQRGKRMLQTGRCSGISRRGAGLVSSIPVEQIFISGRLWSRELVGAVLLLGSPASVLIFVPSCLSFLAGPRVSGAGERGPGSPDCSRPGGETAAHAPENVPRSGGGDLQVSRSPLGHRQRSPL